MATLPDPRHEAYLNWLVTAPAERALKTHAEFARTVGVDRRTLYDWRATAEFRKEWE